MVNLELKFRNINKIKNVNKIGTCIKANAIFHEYILENRLNGKPALTAPKFAANDTILCEVPDSCFGVNSIAITPSKLIGPYALKPAKNPIVRVRK